MNEAEEAATVNYVLTLDEISALTREGGKPAETLMNVVALIARRFQTDVCSAYLLEPDRANLVLAATLGLRPRVHRHAAPGAARRAGRAGGGAGASGGRGAGAEASALQVLRRGGRGSLPVVSRRAADRSRRAAGRAGGADDGVAQLFATNEIRMLVEAAAQVAPVVSEARTLDRFIAPAQERLWALARNLWWSWDQDSTSLFRDLDPVRWRQLNQQSDLAVERRCRWRDRAARRRTDAAQPDQLRVPAPAGVSAGGPDLGRDPCRRAAAPSGGVFFGRVRTARIAADLFRRPGRAGGRPHQERVGPGHSADRDRPVLRPGLFPAAPGRQRLAAGRLPTG